MRLRYFSILIASLAPSAAFAEDAPLPGEAPPVDVASDPDLELPTPTRGHFAFGGGALGTALSLHGRAVYMGGGFLTLGADTRVGSFDGMLRYEQGRTEGGLETRSFGFGPQFSWTIDRLRLGVVVKVGYFGVDRVTSSDTFDYLTGGIEGLLGVDLVRTGGFSMGLSVRPRADMIGEVKLFDEGDSAAVAGVSLGLELRFRAPRKPKKPSIAHL